jgi:hypothetical protein
MAQASDVLRLLALLLALRLALLPALRLAQASERRVAFTSFTTSVTTSFTTDDDGAGDRRVCFLLALLARTDGGTVCFTSSRVASTSFTSFTTVLLLLALLAQLFLQHVLLLPCCFC